MTRVYIKKIMTIVFLLSGMFLYSAVVSQRIPLVQGWNWVSFQTIPRNTDLNSVFASIRGYVKQVKCRDKAAVYSGGKWSGSLTDMSGIAEGFMYKVKTSQDCTLTVKGAGVSVNKPRRLQKGWNWVSYLSSRPLPVNTALTSIIAQVNQVKSQSRSAIKAGNCLTGELIQMGPDNAFAIEMSRPGSLVYPYGFATSGVSGEDFPPASAADAFPVPWTPITGNQYNMIAYGTVFLEGSAINTTGYYLVGLGSNGEGDCRSVSAIGTDGSYFSTILGNSNGETIKFKLYNSSTGIAVDMVESLTFQSDDLLSDCDFTARSVRITAPAGGENIDMGSICVITWVAYNMNNVNIELLKGSRSVLTIASGVSASAQTYSWTIPSRLVAGSDYNIKISCADPGVRVDDTSNAFTIVPLVGLTLNFPVGGETLQVKRSYGITWGSSGISNVKIELLKGGVVNAVISDSTPADPGKFTWTVPSNQVIGSDYKITITCLDGGITAEDTSESTFSITSYKHTAADFNADDKADLIWRFYGSGGYNCVWLTGSTPESSPVADARLEPQAAAIQDDSNLDNHIAGSGDFNGDDKEDILWRNTANGNNSVWFMDGTTFASSASLPVESNLNWDICGCGDLNSDGKTDIAWRNRSDGSNKVWLMDGTTRLSEVSLSAETSQDWDIVGTGDFDGNGKCDLLWRNTSTGGNRVWMMNGTSLVKTESLPSLGTDWRIVGAGDYDGNGKPDIFWRNTADGRDLVWLMDGLTRHGVLNLTRVTDLDWKIEN